MSLRSVGQKCGLEVLLRSVDEKGSSKVSIRSVDQKCCSEVSLRSVNSAVLLRSVVWIRSVHSYLHSSMFVSSLCHPQGNALARPTDQAVSHLLWGWAMRVTPCMATQDRFLLKIPRRLKPQRAYRNSNTRTRGENGSAQRGSGHSAWKAVKQLAFHQGLQT